MKAPRNCMVVAINLQLEAPPDNITVHCNPETMETKVEDDKIQPVECKCKDDCKAIRIELEQKENVKNKKKLDIRERELEVCTKILSKYSNKLLSQFTSKKYEFFLKGTRSENQ